LAKIENNFGFLMLQTIMPEIITVEATGLGGRTGGLLPKLFAVSAGVVLAITGIAKVWTGLGNSKFLAVVDPIVGIKFGQLMLVVGVAEIAVAAVCFFRKRQTLALGLMAWMSTNFVVYRLGLWWMDWKAPCGCLGHLTDALHISPQTADNITKVLLGYLLIGSYGLLIWQWRKTRGRRPEGGGPMPEQAGSVVAG
jgi:hypothetical protein